MKSSVTAVILCGGRGERLWPLTESTPKPLIHLKGRPILSYLLDHLTKFGVTNVVIAAGFQAEKFTEFFQHNHRDLSITIVDSGHVDIIERIKDCGPHLDGDFMVLYGDTLADVNLDELQEFHLSHRGKATITLWPLRSQFGLAQLDEDENVTSFREKPVLDHWINIGSFYYAREVLTWMRDFTSYAEFLQFLGAERKLKGYRHYGVHITVNTLRELEDAADNVHRFALT